MLCGNVLLSTCKGAERPSDSFAGHMLDLEVPLLWSLLGQCSTTDQLPNAVFAERIVNASLMN